MHPRDRSPRVLGARWTIRLLGSCEARNGDIPITHFPSRAARLLLIRLALAPGRRLRKETLVDWLWPREPAVKALHNLRGVKAQLKALLEPPGVLPGSVLAADNDTLMLRAGAVDCDAVRFGDHVRRGEFAAALALYAGELAPALHDDFVDAERERLDRQHQAALRGAAAQAARPAAAPRPAPRQPPAPTLRLLPEHGTAFVDRAFETQTLVAAAASGQRLMAVTGTGGCGKSRLCIEAARTVAGFDIVGFVALAGCRDAALIVEHIRALRQLQAGARSTLEQVVADLEGRRVLLLLDNLEQLGAAALPVVQTLLERLPLLHAWVSSRVLPAMAGAGEIALQPLGLPALHDGPAQALRAPSVALFLARARLARADFNLHARNVGGVVALCRQLEGLPVAIELAAARVRSYTPAELTAAIAADWSAIARIGPQARDAGRHASIKDLVGWSLELLPAAARALLGCLTACDTGVTLDQAAALGGLAADDCRPLLDELVAASLLQRPQLASGGVQRWHMLRSVHDAVQRVAGAPLLEPARQRLRDFFIAAAAAPALAEDEPLLAAVFAQALADGDAQPAAALLTGWHRHWVANGMTPTAAQALQQLAAVWRDAGAAAQQQQQQQLPPAARSRLLALAAPLLLQSGRAADARAAAAAALALAGAGGEGGAGDEGGADGAGVAGGAAAAGGAGADAVRAAALVAWVNCGGRAAADGETFTQPARDAVALAAGGSDRLLHARALVELGRCLLEEEKKPVDAEACFVAAERIVRTLGDEAALLLPVPGQLGCLNALGRFDEMIAVAVRGLERAARLGRVEEQMLFFNRHGVALEGKRRWRQAIDVYRRQASAAMRHGMAYHFAFAAWNQCQPLLKLQRREALAVRLLAFSVRYWTRHFAALLPDAQAEVDALREAARRRIGTAAEAAAWEAGWALSVADGVALAGGSY